MDKTRIAVEVSAALKTAARMVVVDLEAAWPQYTLTDEDRQDHFDATLLATAPKGCRFNVAPDWLVSLPESVRGRSARCLRITSSPSAPACMSFQQDARRRLRIL